MVRFNVRRIAYALGAEITGVDLSKPLDGETVDAIRRTWLEHLLLCFPDQNLDRDQLLALANRFGTPEILGRMKHLERPDPRTSYVDILTNVEDDGKPKPVYVGGQYWHTDESFTTHPTSAAFLHCKAIPEAGGDTMFANMYMGYETLSPKMREIVDELYAIHDVPRRRPPVSPDGKPVPQPPERIPTAQPIARIHPETQRRMLYLGAPGTRVRQIVGMTEEESKPLLAFLNEHAVRYEFTYRHRWKVGEIILWDNRCTLHNALNDYDGQRETRRMLRVALVGEESGYPYRGDGADEPIAQPAG